MRRSQFSPWKHTVFQAIAQAEAVLRPVSFINPGSIRNFLILACEQPLGSAVHATPLYEALQQAMPDAHVSVAASGMAASVLAHNPFVDRLRKIPDPAKHFLAATAAVRRELAALPPGPRVILTTIGNRQPRLALLALLAGRALRAGHTAAPQLYPFPQTFTPERGQIEGNLDILRALGHAAAFHEPRVFFTSQDVAHAAALLPSTRLRIALIPCNSGGQRNQWEQSRFAAAISSLTEQHHASPVFLGTAADAAAIDRLRGRLPNPGISAAGKTTIPQLAALLAQCDLALGLDTGPFHVARAVGLPAVVLAPAWQDAREWLPIEDPRFRILQGPRIAKPSAGYRMQEISVEQVLAATAELLEAFPTSREARQARVDRSCVG